MEHVWNKRHQLLPDIDPGEMISFSIDEEYKPPTYQELKEKELLSPKEVTILLSISSSSLQRYTERGILIKHALGSKVYYYFSEVIAALVKLDT